MTNTITIPGEQLKNTMWLLAPHVANGDIIVNNITQHSDEIIRIAWQRT